MSFNSIVSLYNGLKLNILLRANSTTIPYSKLNFLVLKKLIQLGYVRSITCKNSKQIKFTISDYTSTGLSFQGLNLLSSSTSRRTFFCVKKLKRLNFNSGIVLLSTKFGILTRSEALKKNTGGILLIAIW